MFGDRQPFLRASRGSASERQPVLGGSFLQLSGSCKHVSKRLIAVGTAVAGGPPHRSVREYLPHTAPTLSRARNRWSG